MTPRLNILSALVWRTIAEIARHQHVTHALELEQYHPGSSQHGAIQLRLLARRERRPAATFDFELGGPSPGRVRVRARDKDATWNLLELLEEDPAARLVRLQELAGLVCASGPLPPSSDRVLALRLIAGLLERKAFVPEGWRTTCGVWSHDGGYAAAGWAGRWLPKQAPVDDDKLGAERVRLLSDLVLMHPFVSDCSPLVDANALVGPAVGVDLGTGAIGRLTTTGFTSMGGARDLYGKYQGAIGEMIGAVDAMTTDD